MTYDIKQVENGYILKCEELADGGNGIFVFDTYEKLQSFIGGQVLAEFTCGRFADENDNTDDCLLSINVETTVKHVYNIWNS